MDTPGRIPLLLVGDGPNGISGLSRILTDLLVHLVDRLGSTFEVAVCGYRPWDGLPPQGIEEPPESGASSTRPYRVWVFSDLRHWGKGAVSTAYRYFFGNRPGVLCSIWDPARCYAFTELKLPVERWGYFPVDAHNLQGELSGPAMQALLQYDRVLAYTAYGATVITKTREHFQPMLPEGQVATVPHLPHGISANFSPGPVSEAAVRILFPEGHDGDTQVVGCVATNQGRKDWGLFFRVLQILRERRIKVRGWAHVDREIGEAWSLPQLAADTDCRILDVRVTQTVGDPLLADLYRACAATIAIGRGEGFGYPIVESQACGAPVVHADYAGGAELTAPWGRITPAWVTLEGPHALKRPHLEPAVVAGKVQETLTAPMESHAAHRASVAEYAAPYRWPALWPQWEAWWMEGALQWIWRHQKEKP